MLIWSYILVAGILSFLLRALPFLVFTRIQPKDDGEFANFLDYVVSAIIGGIIYLMSRPHDVLRAAHLSAPLEYLVMVVYFLLVFVIAVKLNRPLLSFILSFVALSALLILIS